MSTFAGIEAYISMNIIEKSIEGVVIIEPKVFGDHRGYFFESFSQKDFCDKVRQVSFVQDNESSRHTKKDGFPN